jgi:hypothetical protein
MEVGFSIKGFWWLPERPEEKCPGILTYSPGASIYLDLFQELPGNRPDSRSAPSFTVIHGFSSSGKLFSLIDTFVAGQKSSYPGFPETKIIVNAIYEGFHFSKKTDLRFHTLKTSLSYLKDWVWFHGFTIDHDLEHREVQIAYKLPEEIVYKVNDSVSVKINFVAKTPSHDMVQREATVRENVELHIVSTTELDIFELLKYQYQLSNLLSLAVGESITTLSLVGLTELSKREIGESSYLEPVNIYFNQTNEVAEKKEVNPWSMLFSFPRVKDRFEPILQKWFGDFDRLESIFSLFFYTVHAKQIAAQTKLLNLSEAIEAYHRKVVGGSYMDKEKFAKDVYPTIAASIPQELSSDFRDGLKGKIKYGYEYSLRKRLGDLFKSLNDGVLVDIFVDTHDRLIKQIVESRNYYTHYDEKTPNVCDLLDLHGLCNKVEAILIVIFLTHVGFGKEEIKQIVSENWRLRQMLS